MSVNGVSNVNNYYGDYKKTENYSKQTVKDNTSTSQTTNNESGVIYESTTDKIKNATEKERKQIVAQMKKDTETRLSQMQNLVMTMFNKQGSKVNTLEDMWKQLASGDFTADKATIAKAKEDISEDGYWGVELTSQRIFDFAVALSGGDPEKMEKMKDAVTKGFNEATKSWGKTLPDISQKTYEAAMKKFEDYNKENTVTE